MSRPVEGFARAREMLVLHRSKGTTLSPHLKALRAGKLHAAGT
jgi:hypothetical protein